MAQFVALIVLLFSTYQASAAISPCTALQTVGAGIVASRFNTVALGCVVQVTPRAKPNLLYRDYWFDERGRFLVFTSVPGDNPDLYSGTRTFFLFPRKRLPVFEALPQGDVALTIGSGERITFDGFTSRIVGFPGKIREAREISLENRGGVEIESFNGIYLDSGWKRGSEAYKDPNGDSVFVDAHGAKCTVRNDEFFFYENMYYSEPNLRFADDSSLAEFLSARCPGLDLAPLRPDST